MRFPLRFLTPSFNTALTRLCISWRLSCLPTDISAYGEGNDQRLTGKHETASIDTFKWGVADRGASIRIGNETAKEGKGYLEDRRPAGNGKKSLSFT